MKRKCLKIYLHLKTSAIEFTVNTSVFVDNDSFIGSIKSMMPVTTLDTNSEHITDVIMALIKNNTFEKAENNYICYTYPKKADSEFHMDFTFWPFMSEDDDADLIDKIVNDQQNSINNPGSMATYISEIPEKYKELIDTQNIYSHTDSVEYSISITTNNCRILNSMMINIANNIEIFRNTNYKNRSTYVEIELSRFIDFINAKVECIYNNKKSEREDVIHITFSTLSIKTISYILNIIEITISKSPSNEFLINRFLALINLYTKDKNQQIDTIINGMKISLNANYK